MRAIVHSIHSQVPATISTLGRLDTIVSMDSHLDVSLGGDDGIYPARLRLIVGRTAAHAAMRRIAGGFSALTRRDKEAPRLVIAVPEAMLARHVADVEEMLPRPLRVPDQAESVSSYLDFLAEDMGIEVYTSPPKSLRGLAKSKATRGRWLLDIDVDYMHEMQGECYTRIINPGRGVLQSVASVVRFVEESRPETITLSEAKVAAIRDPRSEFSRLIRRLESLGYEVEESGVFADDKSVVKDIALCREFYRTVSSRLMRKHMDEMMRGEEDGFQREEAAAATAFFRDRGF